MAKLRKYHDVSGFCSDKPFKSGAPQDHAKFDAQSQSIMACDGKIAIVVPFSEKCDAPDALIPPAKLKTGTDKHHAVAALDGELALNNRPVKPNGSGEVGKFGNVFGVLSSSEPDVLIPLSLETLEPLVEYTRTHGRGGIYLCVSHAPGDDWRERKVTQPIRFFFDVGDSQDEKETTQVVGCLMPCAVDNAEAVHSRLRGAISLINSGKSAKDKAAAARRKAADKKAAAPVAAPKGNGNGKRRTQPQGVVAEEEVEEITPMASTNGKAKAKVGKNDAAKNGKAAPAPTPATPKAVAPKKAASNCSSNGTTIGDLLTRARASISRGKLAAAKRTLNKAREMVIAGDADSKFAANIDQLLAEIVKGRK